LTIRLFTPDDLDALGDITRASWHGVAMVQLLEQRYGHRGAPWGDRKAAEVVNFCRAHPDQVVVAEEDNQIIGYATFYWTPEDKIGEVGNNAVLPQFRGRGIGTALIAQTIHIMKDWGAAILRVTTFEHDYPARHIYERLGFQEIARSIHFTMRPQEARL
jgi:ribosomal protein S18 acetylase RimI-like enzyme